MSRARRPIRRVRSGLSTMQGPAMNMGFLVEDKAQLAGLKKGDAVEFEFRAQPNKEGDYVVTRIAPGARK